MDQTTIYGVGAALQCCTVAPASWRVLRAIGAVDQARADPRFEQRPRSVAEFGLPARIKAARQPCAKGRDVGTGEPHAALRELRFQIPVQRVDVGALARDVQLEAASKKHAPATFERLNL